MSRPDIDWQYFPARALPEIELAGTKFYLDLRLWEMREVDDCTNVIKLDHCFYEYGRLEFTYDLTKKNLNYKDLVDGDPNIRHFKLPPLSKIDPVGWYALQKKKCRLDTSELIKRPEVKVFKGLKI